MFQGARDSYVDLLEIKAKKEDESKKKLTKTTSSSSRRERIVDNLLNGNNAEKRQTSFRPSKKEPQSTNNKVNNITYEPVQVDDENEDDINWLIWEMTTNNPWRDNITTMEERVTSIAACERIFTVPEVYDDLQCGLVSDLSSLVLRDNSSTTAGINEGEVGPCSNIFHCFNPWKQQQTQMTASNDAFQDYNPQEQQQQPQDLIQRSSMAVSNYLNLPPSKRKVYIPSMFNTTNTNNNNNDHKAYLKGCMKRPTSTPSSTSTTTKSTKSNKYKRVVHFSEIKRILRITKFTSSEQLEVWYQKIDFDYFKNEMTLLIQQDGASRELAQVWLEAQACESSRRGSSSDEGSGSSDEEDKQQHQHHNSKPTRRKHNRDDSNSSTKWWHDYDHSRRGLERYASPGQARQILASYKIAVKKVLGEQQRQRLLGCLFIPGVSKNDVEKIAEIYHSYTSWSRDLALAAGASDADAVRTNFDENKRHTREYYLLKQIVASGNLVHKHMPQFMLPKCIKPKGFIDESKSLLHHSSSTIQMRPRGLGKRSVSVAGKEAREEMSRLDNNDVTGPVSPMLASLQVNSADHDLMGSPKSTGSVGSRASSRASEVKKSMAEKAKNYPFQH